MQVIFRRDMPKRIKNVFDDIFSMDNLYDAYVDAARGRRYEREVLRLSEDLWTNLEAIRDRVYAGDYEVRQYHKFYVYEPKKRLIMSIPFEDRVVQWAIYRIINPIIVKSYINDSYGCIPGRGALGAMERLREWLKVISRKPGKWYYLKIDISKYFYRISHRILKQMLRRRIADERLLKVLDSIIDCRHTAFGLPEGVSPNDGVEMIHGVGMPIGNLLSQMFANLYLDALDEFCKRVLHCRIYVRYMDDVIIVGIKEMLKRWRKAIETFASERLALKLNRKTCIRPINQGIEFVGYRLWHTHVTLRKSTTLKMRRGLRHVMEMHKHYKMSLQRAEQTFRSYIGMLSHTDSKAFVSALYERFILTHEGGTVMT
jgi:RNA-directed DNA polymerase